MAKRLMVLLGMLALMLATAVPATAQEGQYGSQPDPMPPAERVTVTFELTLDGEVPGERSFGLGHNAPIDSPGVGFCHTAANPDEYDAALPRCEAGGTYSATLEVPAGRAFHYDFLYYAFDAVCDGMGPTEIFFSGEQAFTEDTIVRAAYTEDGLPEHCRVPGGEAEVAYELFVEGEPPAEATFWGISGGEGGGSPVLLADPDGDGVYTGTPPYAMLVDTPEFFIVQGTGTQDLGRLYPGEPSRVIKDFGTVWIEEETTLSASVSFDGGTEPVDPVEPAPVDPAPVDPTPGGTGSGSGDGTGGAVVSGDTNNANKSANGSVNASSGAGQGGASPVASVLPATGGILPVAAAAGALLILGGLVARRIFR